MAGLTASGIFNATGKWFLIIPTLPTGSQSPGKDIAVNRTPKNSNRGSARICTIQFPFSQCMEAVPGMVYSRESVKIRGSFFSKSSTKAPTSGSRTTTARVPSFFCTMPLCDHTVIPAAFSREYSASRPDNAKADAAHGDVGMPVIVNIRPCWASGTRPIQKALSFAEAAASGKAPFINRMT